MSDQPLPPPLVAADVDLRGFRGFMLDVDRLLASELVALGTPEECWAATMLWCRAWKQTPPASLPDDDRVLAAFSGAGKRWSAVKTMALRGFVKCSDGRLYHKVLAQEANEAWRRRSEHRENKGNKTERQKRWRERCKQVYEQLREMGVTAPRGASLETLEAMLRDATVDASASTRTSTDSSTVDDDVDAQVDASVGVFVETGEIGREGTGTGTGTEKNKKPIVVTSPEASPARVGASARGWQTIDDDDRKNLTPEARSGAAIVRTIPTRDGPPFRISGDLLAYWERSFRGIDALGVLDELAADLEANPSNRPASRSANKWLRTCLGNRYAERAQINSDSGATPPAAAPPPRLQEIPRIPRAVLPTAEQRAAIKAKYGLLPAQPVSQSDDEEGA